VERLTVVAGPWAYTNYMTTNLYASYFSQWAKCDTAKRILSASLADGKWVYPAGSYAPDTLAVVNKSNLLAKFSLPTNWWDVTPRFNFAMETNGWRFIPAVASNVVWAVAIQGEDTVGVTNEARYYGHGETNTSLADAYNLSISDYSAAVPVSRYTWAYSYVYYVGGVNGYRSDLEKNYCDLYDAFAVLPHITNCSFLGTAFVKVDSFSYGDFETHGDNVSTNYLEYITWTNSIGQDRGDVFKICTSEIADHPESTTNSVSQGWALNTTGIADSNIVFLYRFNAPGLTNGFKWFR
jgi:hypothetical protein